MPKKYGGGWKREVDIDKFAIAISDELSRINETVEAQVKDAVRVACREGKDEIENHLKMGGNIYKNSFGYTVAKTRTRSKGEIGNKQYQLVHLLERGHAKVGGGHTTAFPHMKYGKETAERVLEEELGKVVENAIGA